MAKIFQKGSKAEAKLKQRGKRKETKRLIKAVKVGR